MKCQREKFNLQRKYAYLNCAYMSPLLKKVENAGIKGIKKKRKPFHLTTTDFFQETETVRLLFSELTDNKDPHRVVIVPSVSYGMANVVNNLPFDSGKIILVEEQFPSNVYPWMSLNQELFKLNIVSAPDSSKRASDWNAKIIDAIDEETRVVSIGHVHWSDGTLFDLLKIRKRLDEVGGLLIIDGTQSIGAYPFSLQKIRPDAVICGAYKWLMGPYSIGLAYYGKAFDHGRPIEENWINRKNSDDFAGLVNYQEEYQPGALRYEVGEHSNFILIPMLHEALKQLLRWSPDCIQTYCSDLMKEAIPEITEWGYQIEDERWRASHLFGVRPVQPSLLPDLKKSFEKHRVSVSFRGDAIRVSPNVYNDEMDVRKLLKALKEPIFAS